MTIQQFVAGQTLTAAQMNTLQASDFNYSINTQSGTSYTLALSDFGNLIKFTNSGSVTLTVPPDSSVSFQVGDVVELMLDSIGTVTVVGGSGVTVNSETGSATITSRYTITRLVKMASNSWILSGALVNTVPDASITEGKIANSAVTTDKLANSSVTSGKIADGTIVNADVNVAAAIAYSKLSLSNSITPSDLAAGAARAGFRSVINPQTGTSYTLQLSDLGKLVELNNSGNITLTVPLDSNVNFTVGDRIDILQTGSGQVTILGQTGIGGVVVQSTPGLKLRAQWSSATLIKRASDSWVAIGDLSA